MKTAAVKKCSFTCNKDWFSSLFSKVRNQCLKLEKDDQETQRQHNDTTEPYRWNSKQSNSLWGGTPDKVLWNLAFSPSFCLFSDGMHDNWIQTILISLMAITEFWKCNKLSFAMLLIFFPVVLLTHSGPTSLKMNTQLKVSCGIMSSLCQSLCFFPQ